MRNLAEIIDDISGHVTRCGSLSSDMFLITQHGTIWSLSHLCQTELGGRPQAAVDVQRVEVIHVEVYPCFDGGGIDEEGIEISHSK